MTTYDLIGAPFPKGESLFDSDVNLQKKLMRLESFIEMHHDIQQVADYLETASKITEGIIHLERGDVLSFHVSDALAVAAIVLYAKLFNSSKGRTVLNKNHVFPDPVLHDSFIDVRDKFLAHQEWNANKHQIFFFQDSKSLQIRMNPYGQTTRIPIWPNLNWDGFNVCIDQVKYFLKTRIEDLCNSIVESLNPDQLAFLNGASKNALLQDHWAEQPHLRKDPFSSRSKS